MTGIIFDVQRFSVHDGPGIRTTVFMNGCPLRCKWCHNPEGLSQTVQLQFFSEKCIGCGACGKRERLSDAKVCPAEALRVCGKEVDENEIISEIIKDRIYYADNGGVTFSGGECFIQADFVASVLKRAKELGIHTISGCNFLSYYNDDLFVESLNRAGIPIEYARDYGFDLCQDINIPGKGDFWLIGTVTLTPILMSILKSNRSFEDFGALVAELKARVAYSVSRAVSQYNIAEEHLALYAQGRFDEYFDGTKNHGKPVDRQSNSPMAPLPLLSALFHGSVEKGLDVAFEPYPIKEKGMFVRTAVEAINSLAAIKKVVFDEKRFTLDDIYAACESDFAGENGNVIKNILWNCPKWGNDDDYVDSIAKDILEYSLREFAKYKTFLGGQVLGGIHQPHPVINGAGIMATPEGRNAGTAVAVTLTPESGTMKNGPTAALCSAAKLNPMLIQWNYCVMVNYFASVFKGNNGKEIFKTLLGGYFKAGGLQHQPNVSDVEELKKAQLDPKKYKDLIVRLWAFPRILSIFRKSFRMR